MKKIFISVAAVAIALSTVSAREGALDLRSRNQLRQLRLEKNMRDIPQQLRGIVGKNKLSQASRQYVGSFVKIAPGYTAADLEAAGFHVATVRGDIAICSLPVDRVEELAEIPAVFSINLERPVHTNMDKARAIANLDQVHQGVESPQETRSPYTGKGILVGVYDEGIDPNHVNFLNPDGTHRVGYMSHILPKTSAPGYDIRGYFGEDVAKFSTDSEYQFHGTHTLGIAGGGYQGKITMADYSKFTDKDTPVPLIEVPNPYYGAAPDASLVASTGLLNDGFIALGVDQMCQYAYEKEQPLVVSLSLGSNSGPHDVRSNMSQFLDLTMTKGPGNPNPPIICISAGNEGDHKIALKKTLKSHDDVLRTMIWPYAMQYDPDVDGSVTLRQDDVAIYSPDATPLEIKAVIYNKQRGYRAYLPMGVEGDGVGSYVITDEYFRVTEEDKVNLQLAKYFDGYVGIGGMIEPETGRYYAMLDYALQNNSANLDDNYVLGFEIRVRQGETIPEGGLAIECYCSGTCTEMYNYGQESFDDGSRDGSISDMAVSPKLIVVGSYNSREDWICLDGLRAYYVANDPDYFKPGYVSGFSSFGTLSDGRSLPTVCAPGSSVISSVNRYYSKQIPDEQVGFTFQAVYTDANGEKHYWKQEPGTSMACPFLAGSIACWLEADPTLDYEKVRKIIKETAVVDDQVLAAEFPVQWGAGKFDALAGLKEVIRTASIDGVSVDDHNSRLIVTPAGANRYTIFVGNASQLDVNVYNTQGALVKSASVAADELTLDMSDMTTGVYVVSANGIAHRVLVK